MRARSRWVVGGTALVVLVGAGATAYARSTDDPSGAYRLATVSTGTVEETLTSSGTVDKKDRADVTLGTGGTVATVQVSLGQRVRSGQVLATLDPTDAQASVDSAEASLAKARAQLVSDEDAQSSTVSSSSSSGTTQTTKPKTTKPKTSKPKTSTGSGQGSGSGSNPGSGVDTQAATAALAQLATQQQAVTSGQSAVTQALGDAADALTAQQQACSTTAAGAGTGTGTGVSPACQDALSTVQDEQQTVRTTEQALSDALTTLTTTLTNAVAALQKAASTTASSSRTTVSLTAYRTTTASTDDTSSAPTGSGQTVTAATLAKDQAAIDTARADLISAQRSLAATTVRAPMAGRVASLSLTKGDAVSSGDTATVITDGAALLIDTTVSESKIRDVTVGQKVVVSTPGSSTTSQGTVSAIGVTADSASSSVAYPVTVQVPQPSSMLASGSSVVLQIVTSTASDVVTVPSSAVSTTSSGSTVQVRSAAGTVSTQRVTLGAVGSTRTQVRTGLKVGQRVVLADLGASVTGASTTVDTRGAGGPGGAGFPGGGTRTGGGTGGPPGAP